jgi:hypothetical protein
VALDLKLDAAIGLLDWSFENSHAFCYCYRCCCRQISLLLTSQLSYIIAPNARKSSNQPFTPATAENVDMESHQHHPRVSTSTPPSSPAEKDHRSQDEASLRERRVEFALFLKVLLRCLKNSQQTSVLRQTRLVVFAFIRGHSRGDPAFDPLEKAIEFQLKRLIDEKTWDQAKRYTRYYLNTRQRRLAPSFYAPNPFIQFVLPGNVNRDYLALGATRVEQI